MPPYSAWWDTTIRLPTPNMVPTTTSSSQSAQLSSTTNNITSGPSPSTDSDNLETAIPPPSTVTFYFADSHRHGPRLVSTAHLPRSGWQTPRRRVGSRPRPQQTLPQTVSPAQLMLNNVQPVVDLGLVAQQQDRPLHGTLPYQQNQDLATQQHSGLSHTSLTQHQQQDLALQQRLAPYTGSLAPQQRQIIASQQDFGSSHASLPQYQQQDLALHRQIMPRSGNLSHQRGQDLATSLAPQHPWPHHASLPQNQQQDLSTQQHYEPIYYGQDMATFIAEQHFEQHYGSLPQSRDQDLALQQHLRPNYGSHSQEQRQYLAAEQLVALHAQRQYRALAPRPPLTSPQEGVPPIPSLSPQQRQSHHGADQSQRQSADAGSRPQLATTLPKSPEWPLPFPLPPQMTVQSPSPITIQEMPSLEPDTASASSPENPTESQPVSSTAHQAAEPLTPRPSPMQVEDEACDLSPLQHFNSAAVGTATDEQQTPQPSSLWTLNRFGMLVPGSNRDVATPQSSEHAKSIEQHKSLTKTSTSHERNDTGSYQVVSPSGAERRARQQQEEVEKYEARKRENKKREIEREEKRKRMEEARERIKKKKKVCKQMYKEFREQEITQEIKLEEDEGLTRNWTRDTG